MRTLLYRFRPALRVFTAFVATAFLLATLATAADAYADLPDCTQHSKHADQIDSTDHHLAVPDTTDIDDACCGTCEQCHTYFGAHLQGLNFAPICILPAAQHADIPILPVYATDITIRPDSPPPRSPQAQPPFGV